MQAAQQSENREAEQEPGQGEGQADLPPKIQRLPGIIPDIPAQQLIADTAEGQLYQADGAGPAQSAAQQRATAAAYPL